MLVSAFLFSSILGGINIKAEESQKLVVEPPVVETEQELPPQGLIEKMGELRQLIVTTEAEYAKLSEKEVVIQNQIDITNTKKAEIEVTLVNLKNKVEVNTERIDTIKALTEKDKEAYQVAKKATTDGLSNKPLVVDLNSNNAKEKNIKEDIDLATEKGELQKSIIEDTEEIKTLTIELAEKEVEVKEQATAYEEFLAGKAVVENQLRENKIGYEASKQSLVNYSGDLQSAVDELIYTGFGKFQWPVHGFNTISSPYGPRWGTIHQRIDIGILTSNPFVLAADDGIVVASEDNGDGFGNKVIINHGSS